MKKNSQIARLALSAVLIAGACGSAGAEVTALTDGGFEVTHKRELPKRPASFLADTASPQSWWSEGHTYSQKAANLRLDARPGGCFCETWKEGAVEHARVLYAAADELRLQGALGPLQPLAANGVLSFTLAETNGKPVLQVRYRVGGMDREDARQWAPRVDGMMSETADHLAAWLSRSP